MTDKVYLPMNPKMRDELRYAMNTQFRYKLYRDPVFPFLPALGVDHIIQGFEAKEELGFVGVLHLWYENNSGDYLIILKIDILWLEIGNMNGMIIQKMQ